MALVTAGMEKMIEEATKAVFEDFKSDFVQFVMKSSRIRAEVQRAVQAVAQEKLGAGYQLSQHVLNSIKEEVTEFQKR